MTIDEAIKHSEEVAEDKECLAHSLTKDGWQEHFNNLTREKETEYKNIRVEMANSCLECANEHRQLAQWLRELKELREQIRWIPCSEMLPDTDDMVLCWYKYYHWSQDKVLPEYGLGYYLRNIPAWCGEVANGKDVEVIAWQPLPEPYKVESEE